jgi:hypothetical protein
MANEQLPPAELLRSAARLIDLALADLDTRSTACTECRCRRYNNFDHARVFEQLQHVPARLRSASNRLKGIPSNSDGEGEMA